MSASYAGHLDIYGSDEVGQIFDEAYHRLAVAAGRSRSFDINIISEVFFGSQNEEIDQHIGCRGLVLDDMYKCDEADGLRYQIFFSTTKSYPDYFASYLANKIGPIADYIRIHLHCESETGEIVRAIIRPANKADTEK